MPNFGNIGTALAKGLKEEPEPEPETEDQSTSMSLNKFFGLVSVY